MKILISLILILFSINLNAQEKLIDRKLIIGKWISFDDKNYTITVTDKLFIEYYENEKADTYKYDIENTKLTKTDSNNGDIYEYEIFSISDTALVLKYLPRGNFLTFERQTPVNTR